MPTLIEHLKSNPVIYVTRDIERAMGLPLSTEGYFIISNNTELAKTLTKGASNVLLIDAPQLLNTRELLLDKSAKRFINSIEHASLVVFKSNSQIERICGKEKWPLLNPAAEIAKHAEEKITQGEWLDTFSSHLPPYDIKLCKDVEWRGEPFILQFNHAHTGAGTALIEDEKDLEFFANTYPNRPARCSKLIIGPVFTNNNIVTKDKTLIGNISYQITGLAPFTDNPFATIGNDWAMVHKTFTTEQWNQYKKIVEDVATRFREENWQGLFGIDVIVDESTRRIYLLEINARQPASTTFESELQRNHRDKDELTVFEAHLMSLLNLPIDQHLVPISDGAQMTQRVTKYKKKPCDHLKGQLREQGYTILEMQNTKIGKELCTIRAPHAFMEGHNILNEKAKALI